MPAEFSDASHAAEHTPDAAPVTPEPPAAPEWLPEKFVVRTDAGEVDIAASSAKMGQSYGELERKFSAPKDAPAPDPAEAQSTPEGKTAVETARQYFDEHGALDDGMYAQLAGVGLDRETVDSYIAAKTVETQASAEKLLAPVGGAAEYAKMTAWAGDNMSADEVTAFNKMIDDPGTARIAIDGLASRYRQAVGWKPSAPVAGDPGGSSSVPTYESSAQMQKDMADPRYASDPAWRAQVAERLRHATF